MGNEVPAQPAVVLRSHYTQLRALLVVAAIAILALTAAVVILATDDDGSRSAAVSAGPQSTMTAKERAYVERMSALSDKELAAAFGTAQPQTPGTRYDGGPEEGSRGIDH